MGLFEDLGKKVESFKQQAESASQEQANRKCAECGTLIYTDRDDCPECDSDRILVRKGWQPADGDGDSDAGETAEDVDGDENPDAAESASPEAAETANADASGEDGSDDTGAVGGDDDRAA